MRQTNKIKEEPKMVKSLSLAAFEKLVQSIDSFRNSGDVELDDDSLDIQFYDNGEIILVGKFFIYDQQRVIL